MPTEKQPRDNNPSQWEKLDQKESQLWRGSLLLLLVLACAFAFSSWEHLRNLPERLGAVPVGIVVLIALFGFYVWRKRREIAELRGFVRGLQRGTSVPPSEQQIAQLLDLVSRSQHGYRELIDSLDHVVFTLSLTGEIQLVNRRFVELLRLGFNDVIHHLIDEFLSEPTQAEAEHGLTRFMERRSWSGLVRARLKKSGEVRFFQCMLHAVVHEDRVVGISGLAEDVTAQRQSEARFTELFETIQEGMYLSTPEGALLEVNPALVRMLGFDSRDVLLQVNTHELYVDPAELEQLQREVDARGAVRNREISLRRKDGATIRCLDSCTPVRDASGRIVRFQGTLVDITERLEMERQLHQEQEFIRRLVDCFPDVIVVLDTEGRFTFVSSRIRDNSGLAPEDLIGQRLGARTHPDDLQALRNVFEDLISGKITNGFVEYRTQAGDGTWRIMRANSAPLLDAAGKITGIVASARDVTEAKRIEQQLIQTEKLAAMGQMIAGVAHELNNPLTAILGVSDLLAERSTDEWTHHKADLIHKQARRASEIVQSLLAFSRPPTTKRALVPLDDAVQRALSLHALPLEKNHVTVECFPQPGLLPVRADANQLVQVFLNLIVNAEQAIREVRDHGRIQIRFGHSGGKVWVSVEDDGPGISPEVQIQIFDPFFTTKRPGGGTGLGLTICMSIIREHGGTIELLTPPRGGAALRVVLPAAVESENEQLRASSKNAAAASALHGHSVLVVDDEEGIRELVQEGLSARGLTVDCAANSEEAIARLAERTYDAILCDFNLPGLSGQQLFEKLRGRKVVPAQRFVFMTGDLVEPQVVASLAERGARVVEKPFRISDLAAVLTEVLTPAPTNAI